MKYFIGIKEGKVWDVCSDLINKRDDDPILDKDYILFEVNSMDIHFGDTWDFDNNINIPDSTLRFAEEKEPEKITLDNHETRIKAIEDHLGL